MNCYPYFEGAGDEWFPTKTVKTMCNKRAATETALWRLVLIMSDTGGEKDLSRNMTMRELTAYLEGIAATAK